MTHEKHFSMIREFHFADWLTLGNAACGVGALFAMMSYLRSQSKSLGLDLDNYNKFDVHIHVPAGATPKAAPPPRLRT